jgi:PelA/Pel-15E family pectate lyase
LRGIEYLLHAQYPNGGWPQVWPLEGGYHDAITFNDDAVTESAETLTLAANGRLAPIQKRDDVFGGDTTAKPGEGPAEDFTFVPAALRARAKTATAKALKCILTTQLRVPAPNGEGTILAIWAQQNDPLTLKPVTARNYEPEALAASESASVLDYLLSLPKPSPAVVASVEAAAAWFNANKIMGYAYGGGRGTPGGRKLTPSPGAGPLWARYYSLTTGKPVFGDRDKSIHDELAEISAERRNGYGLYGNGPARALEEYEAWCKSCLDAKHASSRPSKNLPDKQ